MLGYLYELYNRYILFEHEDEDEHEHENQNQNEKPKPMRKCLININKLMKT